MNRRVSTYRTKRTASAVLSFVSTGVMRSALIVAILGACTFGARAADSYVPGQVLIAPRAGQADAVADMLVRQRHPIAKRSRFSDIVAVSVPIGAELHWVDIFQADPAIAYAELNGIGEGGVVPNDTHFGSQYHHRNTGQSGGAVDADIDSELAWDITTGSSSTVIAVLDTGIDSDHPDFAGRIDPDGFDFVNEDSNPEADHPHGTWTAGCAAANANDGFGVAGVDWNCMILPIKVLNASNLGTVQDLADGLNYVATQADVSIVNMSLINYPFSMSVESALTNCRNNGKILIACAGNSGVGTANSSWPGASPDTITIGGTNSLDERAGFSSTGSVVDFVAPGEAIATVHHGSSANTFDIVSGCSFATPITAGVVGLLLARAAELSIDLDQDDVYAVLLAGAEDQVGLPGEDVAGYDTFHGHGRINARASLDALALMADCDRNGMLDTEDILADPTRDLDNNGTLDECESRANDVCANSILIAAGDTVMTTNGAQMDGPAELCGDFTNDVWFRFTMGTTDTVTISICDADYDVELALYTFTCPASPELAIACSQDDCSTDGATITAKLTPSLYRVRVSGVGGAQGVATLSIVIGEPVIPCPWDCAPDNGGGSFGNGTVNIDDLLRVINDFGAAGGPCDNAPDNGDGTFGNDAINIDDLLGVINNFGDCPAS